jgi:uncharacterized repeat protein (TIGR01451 family)
MNHGTILKKPQARSGLWLAAVLSLLLLVVFFLAQRASAAAVQQIERVSVGTGGVQGDYDTYYAAISADANIVAFESLNLGWGPDQPDINYADIFVRNRAMNVTRKVSVGPGGEPANQRSFHPAVSANGRYISFNSYAGNLVPGDTNRELWMDNGLDVFVYDWQTNRVERVSVTWDGKQIEANSVGFINGDGRFVVFASAGYDIARNDVPSDGRSALYLRELATGSIQRISKAPNGEFPDGLVYAAEANHDARFVVYLSEATNLLPGSVPGIRDVLLYDRQTQQTRRVSQPPGGGLANGSSGPARITPDGRYIVFRSEASNLVPGDTNGVADIFVFDRITGSIELVSRANNGAQANGDSRDPSICGNGRYISFVSDATNLIPQPPNGHRQVYIRDRVANLTFPVTINADGELGNGRGHRAELARDCRSIAFASEASNLVPNDTNNARDLFVGRIIPPANLGASDMRITSGVLEPGKTVGYTFTLRNDGLIAPNAAVVNPLPPHLSIVSGSLTGGAVYNAQTHRVTWNGSVPTEGSVSFSYQVVVSESLTDFTLIENQATLTGDGQARLLRVVFAVNGLKTYLPLGMRQ